LVQSWNDFGTTLGQQADEIGTYQQPAKRQSGKVFPNSHKIPEEHQKSRDRTFRFLRFTLLQLNFFNC